MTDKTTISITTDTKSELNSLGYKDEDYDTIIKRNINFTRKFSNEYDFHEWFKYNFRLLGFDDVIKDGHKSFPDFILKKGEKQVRIELEIYSSNFIRHKHNPKDVDLVICLLKDKELPINTVELGLFEFDNQKGNVSATIPKKMVAIFEAYKKLIPRLKDKICSNRIASNEETMIYLLTNAPRSKEMENYVEEMDNFTERLMKKEGEL